ncbi:nicotinate-nucleotide adenylyltransferase [Hydrocarboniphaga sp.]|uniref:nicotinate-nucleotide adenylyltransferase n=1 Tax=Hydrocarboniphaga sp. TaxID=2033016 RepID=UPI0026224632|nr:nicotinate-nucleotide adenylyltransferase [Hydrocarboniphaga sp.]
MAGIPANEARALNAPFGIFGGTFTPIHNGHLRLALELRERLALESVRVIPSAQPPHREAPQISAQRRMEWVQLALENEPALIADDCELRRAGPSYTHDTLAALRGEFPDRPLVLLLGDDAANQFHTWHRWREIIDLAHLVFVERPYEPPAPAAELLAHLRGRRAPSHVALSQQLAGLWTSANIPPLAISSTRVRRLLKAGRSVRGLVPESVIASFTHKDISLLTHDEDPATD